jgi:alpha-glucosidase (family GH31 glycosyl hydrolase)
VEYGGDTPARVVVGLDGHTVRVEAETTGGDATYGAMRFESPADEQFLGMGERYTRTAFRGAEIYSWCEEGGVGAGEGTDTLGPNGESMTYYPVPWFVSTGGYGFWLDTTYRSTFDFAAADAGVWRVQSAEPRVAFELYVDDDPYALIDAFTARTGRPALPAPWAFGPRRRIGRGNVALGVSEVEAMREMDLAITAADDAVHFLPHLSQVGIEDELTAWTTQLHDLGYKAIGYYNGLVSAEAENAADLYAEGIADGYFLLGPDGLPSIVWLISGSPQEVAQVDFTNADAVTWYQGMFDWALDLGYDGWMYDFGEYVQPDDVASNGMDGREYHNLNPVLYQQAAFEKMEAERPGDYLFFARSGYTGSQAFTPVTWSGDPAASFESTDGLPSMVRASVNLGMSGVPFWGGDIGGFHCVMDGTPEPELITRWIEQGALSPIMQDQDACTGGGDKPGIWDDADTLAAWKTYARLHTRLFPYIWSLANDAVATGAPLVRHVYLEERDPAYATDDTTSFLGPALFVAPVLEKGATSRSVRFPGGESYLDWDDATVHTGTETVDAPIGKLPLYLRRGYIVPLLREDVDTLAIEDNPDVVGPTDIAGELDVRGYLAAGDAASFTLVPSNVFETAGTLTASYLGGDLDLRGLDTVTDIQHCEDACVRVVGANHVQISAVGSLDLGALAFTAPEGVRVRWDTVFEP